jgi:hypothetical protein
MYTQTPGNLLGENLLLALTSVSLFFFPLVAQRAAASAPRIRLLNPRVSLTVDEQDISLKPGTS